MCRIRLLASKFIQYFFKRTLSLICRIPFVNITFHSFEIFNIQIEEMAFCKPDFIIIKSNYFQNAQKSECFLDDVEALVREGRFRALLCDRDMLF
jgi:hypothetical protein